MNAPWAAPTDVEEFTPAASWLLGRTPVRKKVWDLLDERAQRKAFTVAGVAQADVIRDVLLALDRAVANGETLDDFKKRVGQQLLDAWAGSVVNPAWRVECLPGDTLVSGGVIRAAHRRWFEGALVEVVTASGRKFSATPNHPMLTRRGWVAAGQLREGDDLIGYRGQQHLGTLGDNHVTAPPSTISQIFGAIAQVGNVERIHGRSDDFHGDGGNCDVDVARPARNLSFGQFAALRDPISDHVFEPANLTTPRFCAACGHLIVVTKRCGFCDAAPVESRRHNDAPDGILVNTERAAKTVGAFAGDVSLNDLFSRQVGSFSRGPATSREVQSSGIAQRSCEPLGGDHGGYPSSGGANLQCNALDAEARNIEFDHVASRRFVPFRGHVFNLSTAHGYFTINGLYTGNTIYRTNVQLAYNAGRHQQMTEPALLKVRPFWQFDAILDNRVTLMCEQADGTILPAEHPWWQTNYPPRHFGCRSVVRSIRKSQAERKGITKTPSTEPSQDGFGLTPDAAEWKPDTKKYPPEIRKELEARLKRLDKRPVQRTPKPEKAEARPKPKSGAGPKPEHTVEHWEKEFSKYGDAARAMAWGRAAQERGLDMTAKQVGAIAKKHALDKYDGPMTGALVDRVRAVVEAAKTHPDKSVRELLKGDDGNAVASILGHIANIDSAKGTAKVTNRPRKMPGLDRAKAFYDAMMSKKLDGRAQIRFVNGRAYCDIRMSPPRVNANDLRSLIHEWGHAIETLNASVHKAAVAFLGKRTAGEVAKPLSALTGIPYGWSEVAKPDKFFSAYCGKIYQADATELLSMGAEKVATDPFWTYREDSEHFWWVLGCLGGYA